MFYQIHISLGASELATEYMANCKKTAIARGETLPAERCIVVEETRRHYEGNCIYNGS
jgi:hypothetical protein